MRFASVLQWGSFYLIVLSRAILAIRYGLSSQILLQNVNHPPHPPHLHGLNLSLDQRNFSVRFIGKSHKSNSSYANALCAISTWMSKMSSHRWSRRTSSVDSVICSQWELLRGTRTICWCSVFKYHVCVSHHANYANLLVVAVYLLQRYLLANSITISFTYHVSSRQWKWRLLFHSKCESVLLLKVLPSGSNSCNSCFSVPIFCFTCARYAWIRKGSTSVSRYRGERKSEYFLSVAMPLKQIMNMLLLLYRMQIHCSCPLLSFLMYMLMHLMFLANFR